MRRLELWCAWLTLKFIQRCLWHMLPPPDGRLVPRGWPHVAVKLNAEIADDIAHIEKELRRK